MNIKLIRDELGETNKMQNTENNDIVASINELKKTVGSIHSVVSWILFIMLLPIIFGFMALFVTCLGRR